MTAADPDWAALAAATPPPSAWAERFRPRVREAVADGTVAVAAEITPRPAEIDVYGHVDNAHLVGWLAGGAASFVTQPFRPVEMELAFRAECRLVDRFTAHTALGPAQHFRAILERAVDGGEVGRARLVCAATADEG